MASILAIVSKKIFERDFRAAGKPAALGDVVPTTTYASAHPSLAKLADGGDLFLVTVAPGEQLWLAGVLAQPRFAKDKWVAAPSTTPITNITALIPGLAFENGKGLTAKPGALGMSLQTPRTLTDEDVALLRGAVGGKVSKAAPASSAKVGRTSSAKVTQPSNATVTPAKAASTSAARVNRTTIVPKGTNQLARAGEYLDGGALVEALDALLAAWGQHKAAEVADLIDDLGAHIARALPPIQGNKNTIDAAWRDVGDQRRPADVPRLLAAFDAGSSKQLEGWLDVLDLFPVDPRLCAAAVDMSVKYVASSAGPTRTRANRLAEKIADGRCLPQIDKLIAKRSDAWNATELRDRLRKLKTKFAPPPALAKEDKPSVAALAKTIAKLPPADAAALIRAPKQVDDDGARLLAEVLADPASEAPRLVYADWLQQQEDPRGELIALQLQGGNEDRIRKLVKQHAKTWLGPLAAIVSEPVFEHGFLSAATITLKSKTHRDELLRHPLWATLKRAIAVEPCVVESPAMKSLRAVEGLAIADVAALAARKVPLAIETLDGIVMELGEPGERAQWNALYDAGAWTKLHELGIVLHWRTIEEVGAAFEGWQWLLEGKLGARLTRLHVDFYTTIPSVADWLAAFRSPALQTLVLVAERVSKVTIRREGARLAITYAVDERPKGAELDWQLGDVVDTLFAGFPVKAAPRLEVRVVRDVTKAERARMEAFYAERLAGRFATIAGDAG